MFKHLPKEAMQELAARLSRMSMRDVDFEPERHPKDEDIVVIVQKGVNKKIRLGDLRSALIGGLDYSDLSVGMLEEIADYVIKKIESEKLDEWCKKCGGSSDTPTTKTYTFVIKKENVTPQTASVKVNGNDYALGTVLTFDEGDTVKVTATASGYDDYSASYIISKDTSITVAMTKTAVTPTTYTFKITSATPSSATVKVNGSSYTKDTPLSIASGDSVVVTASADGYEDYSKTYTVTQNMSVTVEMTKKKEDVLDWAWTPDKDLIDAAGETFAVKVTDTAGVGTKIISSSSAVTITKVSEADGVTTWSVVCPKNTSIGGNIIFSLVKSDSESTVYETKSMSQPLYVEESLSVSPETLVFDWDEDSSSDALPVNVIGLYSNTNWSASVQDSDTTTQEEAAVTRLVSVELVK